MKTRFLITSLLTISVGVMAQTNGTDSPYTRYGFGLLNERSSALSTSMSGAVQSIRLSNQLNPSNPASYSAIDSLTLLFDVGLTMQNGTFAINGERINKRNFLIDYITAGMQLTKRLGLGFGIKPFSTMGYNIASSPQIISTPSGNVTQYGSYKGEGGLHEAFIGLGYEPFKGFSLGVNAGYMWGDFSHTTLVSFSNLNISSRRREYFSHIKTYSLALAVQYEKQLFEKHKIGLGATYSLGHNVNSAAFFSDQRLHSNTYVGDTISVSNAYQLPHTFGIGISWIYNNRLNLAFDYNLQKWADVKYPTLSSTPHGYEYKTSKGMLLNRNQYAIGVDYIPNPEGLKRSDLIHYRLGLAMATPYTKINNQKGPKNYSVSAGVGLPIINMYGDGSNRCLLNLAVSYERVQPQVSSMMIENYFRFSIGVTFNGRWFAKWKAQ